MSFNPDSSEYVIIREKFKAIKVKDINDIMQHVLKYVQQNSHKAREVMFKQVNKHRKKINYESGDKIFLFNRNIIIDRSFKKLEDKMLKLFSIKKKIEASYQLQLSNFMKIHDVFHSHLMRKNSDDSLLEQIQKSFESIIIKEDEKYELNDIDNFR